jgi:hypothetical protein
MEHRIGRHPGAVADAGYRANWQATLLTAPSSLTKSHLFHDSGEYRKLQDRSGGGCANDELSNSREGLRAFGVKYRRKWKTANNSPQYLIQMQYEIRCSP